MVAFRVCSKGHRVRHSSTLLVRKVEVEVTKRLNFGGIVPMRVAVWLALGSSMPAVLASLPRFRFEG